MRNHRIPVAGCHLSWSSFAITFAFLCLSSFEVLPTWARTTKGEFRLSGLHTEYVLGSFAIHPKQMGYMKVVLKSRHLYEQSQDLTARLYRDNEWSAYEKAPSCSEKVPLSRINEPVQFHKKKKHYEVDIAMPLDNIKSEKNEVKYYYFVITDCSLERFMHDDTIPLIKFELQTWDNGSHVSADEAHLKNLHTWSLIISGTIALTLAISIMITMYEKSTVHAARFLVMAAATFDSVASLFEIIHLSLYSHDGIGSYFLDCLSAHLEGLCDALVALLLLSIASGWTLPSDVIPVQQNGGIVQNVLGGLQSPFSAISNGTPSAILALAIVLLHIMFAQWGRVYNDDFDSYHDLAHFPGKLLMFLRICLGVCLIICCAQTKSRCPASLHEFYWKLAFVGSFWFYSLPVLTWIVNTTVDYHKQHWAVGTYGAVLQTTALVLLTWLVTTQNSKSSYHKLSHLSAAKDNLTDSLNTVTDKGIGMSDQRIWKFGKAKVRLD